MNAMKYKGYYAKVEFDEEDRIFFGHLAGIPDIVGFHGTSVDELEKAFREAVDNYLSISEETGRKPKKPASGKILLRLTPEVHSAAMVAAEVAGISLNQWAAKVLEKAAHS